MKKILLTLGVAVALSGCIKDQKNENRCEYNECALVAPAAEIAAVRAYLEQNNIQAQQHCSGLFYEIDSVGTGATPSPCGFVAVRYKGMLTNGNVFDSSPTTSQFFPLSNLVRGWINGLPKIKEGGGIKLFIPPTLGYGAQERRDQSGNVLIPANSIMIFEVQLDRVAQ